MGNEEKVRFVNYCFPVGIDESSRLFGIEGSPILLRRQEKSGELVFSLRREIVVDKPSQERMRGNVSNKTTQIISVEGGLEVFSDELDVGNKLRFEQVYSKNPSSVLWTRYDDKLWDQYLNIADFLTEQYAPFYLVLDRYYSTERLVYCVIENEKSRLFLNPKSETAYTQFDRFKGIEREPHVEIIKKRIKNEGGKEGDKEVKSAAV